mmetsp:Transcript_18683/g.46929  ORF Transcript_18683/g.46929 Transcript_18683/m.46929 type:complete len:122 (+) Transcript_18683:1271-1636(+)
MDEASLIALPDAAGPGDGTVDVARDDGIAAEEANGRVSRKPLVGGATACQPAAGEMSALRGSASRLKELPLLAAMGRCSSGRPSMSSEGRTGLADHEPGPAARTACTQGRGGDSKKGELEA